MSLPKENLTREQRLIELIKQITAENLIGDDCAILPGLRLVSSDMLVEGKHFLLPQIALADLGWKAMAVNLSDIAAMAGIPEFALVNLAFPDSLSDEDFRQLYASLQECACKYGTRIVGGDLTGSDKLVISITVLGRASGENLQTSASPLILKRSGARVGQLVIATGDFGASALGLELILRSPAKGENPPAASKGDGIAEAEHLDLRSKSESLQAYALEDNCESQWRSYPRLRHCRPQPRLYEAQQILESCGTESAALMDTSDGLADALLQIARASSVAIEIDESKIPIHESVISGAQEFGLNPLDLALYGGEDYELLACVSEKSWNKLRQLQNPVFKVIGRVIAGAGVNLLTKGGSERVEIEAGKTYQHWSDFT